MSNKKQKVFEPVLTVQLKFNPEQRKVILGFISELNQSDDGAIDMGAAEFCKRAVFYAINDARRRAIELQSKEGNSNGEHDSVSPDAEGTVVPVNDDTNSAALADAQGT